MRRLSCDGSESELESDKVRETPSSLADMLHSGEFEGDGERTENLHCRRLVSIWMERMLVDADGIVGTAGFVINLGISISSST